MIISRHDDVIKWKHFPRYWPFVRGIYRSPVNSPHKGRWRGAMTFSLICVWTNSWLQNVSEISICVSSAPYSYRSYGAFFLDKHMCGFRGKPVTWMNYTVHIIMSCSELSWCRFCYTTAANYKILNILLMCWNDESQTPYVDHARKSS